jgi:hypothetical protein
MLMNDPSADRGWANLISLEPIAERLGDRWERKREDIWLHVDNFLKRHFRADDLIVRLDEFNFLVAQPGKETLAAQAACVRASAELMKFFLGETCTSSVRIKVVDAVDEEGVVAAPVPVERVKSMLLAQTPGLGRPARVKSTPVLTRLGRNISMTVALQPLWNLQPAPRLIGHYANVKLCDGDTGEAISPAERSRLQPGELSDVDVATLQTAMEMRRASPKLAGGLIVPVSYLTLANTSTRFQMLQAVQQLLPSDRKTFGWEIVDLESGIPAGRLSELVGIARRYCRGVMCQLGLPHAEKVHAAGATLTLPPSEVPCTELAMFRHEAAFLVALKSVRAVLLHDMSPDLLPVAGAVGVSHCTLTETGG